jgi:hypothetical protein
MPRTVALRGAPGEPGGVDADVFDASRSRAVVGEETQVKAFFVAAV